MFVCHIILAKMYGYDYLPQFGKELFDLLNETALYVLLFDFLGSQTYEIIKTPPMLLPDLLLVDSMPKESYFVWGDGNSESFDRDDYYRAQHLYTQDGSYYVTAWGSIKPRWCIIQERYDNDISNLVYYLQNSGRWITIINGITRVMR